MSILTFIPFILFILLLILPVVLFYGKRAIVRGDWSKHRNFMVAGLGLWAVIMLLMTAFLLRNGFSLLFAPYNILALIFFLIALATSIMIALTVVKVVKHQYLPHKMLARKTIKVWGATSVIGALLFAYIGMMAMFL